MNRTPLVCSRYSDLRGAVYPLRTGTTLAEGGLEMGYLHQTEGSSIRGDYVKARWRDNLPLGSISGPAGL